MINQDHADAITSFISETAIVETSFNAETPVDVLWQFPEEALLSSASAEPRSNARRVFAAAAAIVIASVAAAWFAGSLQTTGARVTATRAAVTTRSTVAPSATVPATAASPIPSMAVKPLREEPIAKISGPAVARDELLRATSAPKPVALSVASIQAPKAALVPARTALGTSGAALEAGRPTTPRPTSEPAQGTPAAVLSAAAKAVPETPRVVDTVANAEAPAAPPAEPPTSRAPEAFEAVAARTEQSGIHQALGQYRSAYQRLDAEAARAVWPSVDARALARAFDSLESQELAFDSCQVDVGRDIATAQCRGSATFTPKIGGRGAKLESREWVFQLRKVADGWKIQTAQTKR